MAEEKKGTTGYNEELNDRANSLDTLKYLLKRKRVNTNDDSIVLDKPAFLDYAYSDGTDGESEGEEYAVYANEIYMKGESVFAKCATVYSENELQESSFTEEYRVTSSNIENIKDKIYYSLVQLGTKYETESATEEEDESIILLTKALSNIPGRSLSLSAVVLVEENDDFYVSEENSEDTKSYVAKRIFLNGNNHLFASGFINYDYIGADGGRFCEQLDEEMAETLLEDIDERTYQIIKDNAAEWEKKSIIRKDLAMRVAVLPDLPPYMVKELSHSSNPDIRSCIAGRSDLPDDILQRMLKNEGGLVECAALMNSIARNISRRPVNECVFLHKGGPLYYSPDAEKTIWLPNRDTDKEIWYIYNAGMEDGGQKFGLKDRSLETVGKVDYEILHRIIWNSTDSTETLKYIHGLTSQKKIFTRVDDNNFEANLSDGTRLVLDGVSSEKEGFHVIKKDGKFNYVSTDGNLLLKNWADAVTEFKDGKAKYRVGNSILEIDKTSAVLDKKLIEQQTVKSEVGMKLK